MTTTPVTGEVWGEDREAPRAYLLSEGEKRFAELRPAVDAARTELLAALEGVSDEQARFRPAGGEGEDAWGIAEVAYHLARTEPWILARVRATAAGEEPQRAPVVVTEGDPLSKLLDAIKASHVELLSLVAEIDGSERTDTLWAHPQFGEINCRSWFRLEGLHEADHARQIGKLKALPDFPKE